MYKITTEQLQVIMNALGELQGKIGYAAMAIIDRGLEEVVEKDEELNKQKGK